MKKIRLTRGLNALVDNNFFELISRFKWYAHKSKSSFYAMRGVHLLDGRVQPMYMHHAIAGHPIGKNVIDHINGNGLDNRLENLRIVSSSENARNSRKKREGRVSHVYWRKREKRFVAQLWENGKSKHLGYFRDRVDAETVILLVTQ